MKGFPKRRYQSMAQFLGDLVFLWRSRRNVKSLMRGEGLDPKLRERIMLAVTEVNRCRYCARAHTRMALEEGVTKEDVEAILQGSFEGVPEAERTAVLYAQHWADTEGRPEASATEKLESTYGKEQAECMLLAMRLVKTGNYSGNTADWILYTLSCGRLGGLRGPKSSVS